MLCDWGVGGLRSWWEVGGGSGCRRGCGRGGKEGGGGGGGGHYADMSDLRSVLEKE